MKHTYQKLELIRSAIVGAYYGVFIETDDGFEEKNPLPSEKLKKLSKALELVEDLMEKEMKERNERWSRGRAMKDSLVIECLCADDREHLIIAIGDDEFGKGFMKWFDDGLPDTDSYYYYIDTKIYTQFEWGEYDLNKPEDLIGENVSVHEGDVYADIPGDEVIEILDVHKASDYFPKN